MRISHDSFDATWVLVLSSVVLYVALAPITLWMVTANPNVATKSATRPRRLRLPRRQVE